MTRLSVCSRFWTRWMKMFRFCYLVPYSLCRVCIRRNMSALVGRHLINAFNAWNQQSGIHLPPAWRFLLRPRSLGRDRGSAASKTSRTVIHRTHWQKTHSCVLSTLACKQIHTLQGENMQAGILCTLCAVTLFTALELNSSRYLWS